jgi:hypothetical protein
MEPDVATDNIQPEVQQNENEKHALIDRMESYDATNALTTILSTRSQHLLAMNRKFHQLASILYLLSTLVVTLFIMNDSIDIAIPINYTVYSPPLDTPVVEDIIRTEGLIRARARWQRIETLGSYQIQYIFLLTFSVASLYSFLVWSTIWSTYAVSVSAKQNPFRWIRFGAIVPMIFMIQNSVIGQTEPINFLLTFVIIIEIIFRSSKAEEAFDHNPRQRSRRKPSQGNGIITAIEMTLLVVFNIWSFLLNKSMFTPTWFSIQEVSISIMLLTYGLLMIHSFYDTRVETYLLNDLLFSLSGFCFESFIIWSYVYDIFRT